MVAGPVSGSANDDRGARSGWGYRGMPDSVGGDKPRSVQWRTAAHWEALRRPSEPLVPSRGQPAGGALGDPRGSADAAAARDHSASGGAAQVAASLWR